MKNTFILRSCPGYTSIVLIFSQTLSRVGNGSDIRIDSGYAFLGVAKPKVGKTNIRVSQIIFILYKGKLTKKCVCHSCDNRLCINPNHLWEGTVLDNSKDMVEKGRSTWKLTPQEVAEIYNSKEMGTVLASKYNVSQATISQIRHRKQQLYLTQGYLLC